MRRAAAPLFLLSFLLGLSAFAVEPTPLAPAPSTLRPSTTAAGSGTGHGATVAAPAATAAPTLLPSPVAAAATPPLALSPNSATGAAPGIPLSPAGPAAVPSAADPGLDLAAAAAPALKPDAPDFNRPPPTEPAPSEEISLGWTLLRTVVVLGIVILSIYITLNFGLRRLMGIAAVPRGQAVVQVVERIPLDQKRAMFVIKAAGEYLLIGGGDGALQLIAKLDQTEVEKLQQQRPPTLAMSPLLQRLLKRRDVPAPPAPGDNS